MKQNKINEPRYKKSLRVAFCTTDNREHFRQYQEKRPIFGMAPTALLQGFAGLKGLELHVVSCTQRPMVSPPKLAENIWFHSLFVPKWGWLRTFYGGCVLKTRGLLASIGPDLVHGQGTERDCAIEAVASGCPNLITLHGNIRSVAKKLHSRIFTYYWFQSLLESLVLRRTNGVFCNSLYTKSLVTPLNQKTFLVPNAVRKIFFDTPRQPPQAGPRRLRLLMIGVIAPYKQPLEFLRFLREWRNQSDFPFEMCTWVGRADPAQTYARTFLEELSEAHSQNWAVHFQELAPEPLIQIMDKSDILVHLPTEEAFGLVVAEAMVRGLPILASQTGGLIDFAANYPKICLVPPCPGPTWREALTRELSCGVRVPLDAWPSNRYRPKDVAQRHIEIYREVIASR